MNEEDVLGRILRERLYLYYNNEAKDKTKDELVDIIVAKEIINHEKDKEMETLKLKVMQLSQHLLDITAESKVKNIQTQDYNKRTMNSSLKQIKPAFIIDKKSSLIKEELSISSDDSGEEELKIFRIENNSNINNNYESKSNNISLYNSKYSHNKTSASMNDEQMKTIQTFLLETKEQLVNFLKENSLFEPYKSNTNEIIDSPLKQNMQEIYFYLSNLPEIQFYYKTLIVEYSNQLLQMFQNITDDLHKRLNDLNIKIQNLTNHF